MMFVPGVVLKLNEQNAIILRKVLFACEMWKHVKLFKGKPVFFARRAGIDNHCHLFLSD